MSLSPTFCFLLVCVYVSVYVFVLYVFECQNGSQRLYSYLVKFVGSLFSNSQQKYFSLAVPATPAR